MEPVSIADTIQGSWLYIVGFVVCAFLLVMAIWSGRDDD
jgi:hypothetical protein